MSFGLKNVIWLFPLYVGHSHMDEFTEGLIFLCFHFVNPNYPILVMFVVEMSAFLSSISPLQINKKRAMK